MSSSSKSSRSREKAKKELYSKMIKKQEKIILNSKKLIAKLIEKNNFYWEVEGEKVSKFF